MRPLVPALLIAAGLFVAPARPYAIELITSCGQFVRGSAILGGDLDCSATADDAVKLQGRLHLAGYTLTGNPAYAAVRCEKGPCRIEGPGTLTGGLHGIRSDKNTRLIGIAVSNNVGDGVRADKNARIDGGSVANNGGDGVHADKINAREASISGNSGNGAYTIRKAALFGCSVSGNAGDGVSSDRLAKVSHGTTVTGNALDGVDAGRILLKKDASVVANGTSGACGVSEQCDDIACEYRPVVGSSAICGTSRNPADGSSWGACVGD